MIYGNTSDFIGHPLPKDFYIRTWGLPGTTPLKAENNKKC